MPVLAIASDDPPISSNAAELTAAMQWLAPAWSPAQQAASVSKADAVTLLHVPGSTRRYTRSQLANPSQAQDWWPTEHPPMPHVVAFAVGKARPCALCHLPNGAGEPQSAPLAGLSAAYLTEQITAFRTGARNYSPVMHVVAANLTDADVQAAAAYYAALPMPAGPIHVIETGRVPAMHTDYWMLVPTLDSSPQALGNRLIEMPADVQQMKLRNAHAGYVAYVPPGSIERGKSLARGSATSAACAACHGAGLRGGALAHLCRASAGAVFAGRPRRSGEWTDAEGCRAIDAWRHDCPGCLHRDTDALTTCSRHLRSVCDCKFAGCPQNLRGLASQARILRANPCGSTVRLPGQHRVGSVSRERSS